MAKKRHSEILAWSTGPNVLHVGYSGHEVRLNAGNWLHKYLVETYPNTYGIDISEENLSIMREAGYSNLFCMNAESFEFPIKFDTIIAGELIEHLSNPSKFLVQVKKHLKPQGKLIITTPFPFSLLYILYAWLKFPKTCQNSEHCMWFCIQTLKELSLRSGFQVLHSKLIMDYDLENPSLLYRGFAFIMLRFSWLFPQTLRCNDMLFVLTHQD